MNEINSNSFSVSVDRGEMKSDLQFRRQFIASFQQTNMFPDWQHFEILKSGLHIYAHPDLELSQVSDTGRQITLVLLGYAIDPDYLLYQDIIRLLWPELLNWPINPKVLSMKEKLTMDIRKFLFNMEIYEPVRNLYKNLFQNQRSQWQKALSRFHHHEDNARPPGSISFVILEISSLLSFLATTGC